jgi:hypothetical protein
MLKFNQAGDDYMDQRPTRMHSLNRTSPKGHSFVGTCALCGKPNLMLSDMNTECENTRGLTQGEAVVEAVLDSPQETASE